MIFPGKEKTNNMRLDRFLSMNGFASRSGSKKIINQQRVKVNGKVAKLGDKANDRDVIMVDGERVRYSKKRRKIYIMLNKPRGYVTTMSDELDRKCVTELLDGVEERVYPAPQPPYQQDIPCDSTFKDNR